MISIATLSARTFQAHALFGYRNAGLNRISLRKMTKVFALDIVTVFVAEIFCKAQELLAKGFYRVQISVRREIGLSITHKPFLASW